MCQLLNQLELNLNSKKPFVNQLLGIISLNEQEDRVMASSNSSKGDDTWVDEGLASPPACVVEDSKRHNSLPKTDGYNSLPADEVGDSVNSLCDLLDGLNISDDELKVSPDTIHCSPSIYDTENLENFNCFLTTDTNEHGDLTLSEVGDESFKVRITNGLRLSEYVTANPDNYNSFPVTGTNDSGDLIQGEERFSGLVKVNCGSNKSRCWTNQ